MKVYTEEDVLKMLRSFHTLEMNVQLSMVKLTPIEIHETSDEELEKLAELEYSYDELVSTEIKGLIVSAERAAWIEGVKWYREQLKNKKL